MNDPKVEPEKSASAGAESVKESVEERVEERVQQDHNDQAQSSRPVTSPGLIDVVLSVMAAAIGIQTRANKERDFGSGNPLAYIIAGLIFTILFVLTLIGVVNLVL